MATFVIDQDSIRHGARIARLLENATRNQVGPKTSKVALLLSGGIDSTVAGLAARAVGLEVHAYTFRIGSTPSFDSKHAEKTAAALGWQWTPIELPKDVGAILKEWPRLYDDYHCRKKRHFECSWPFLYVYPAIKEKFVIGGLVGDYLFASGRKLVKLGVAGPDSDYEKLVEFRKGSVGRLLRSGLSGLTDEFNPACMLQHVMMQRDNGLKYVDPFLDKGVYQYFQKLSWQDMHVPRQKHVLAGAYPQLIRAVGHRNHVSYQKGGNVSDHFEGLLHTRVNFKNRRRVLDMFADWWRPIYEADCRRVIDELRRRFA